MGTDLREGLGVEVKSLGIRIQEWRFMQELPRAEGSIEFPPGFVLPVE